MGTSAAVLWEIWMSCNWVQELFDDLTERGYSDHRNNSKVTQLSLRPATSAEHCIFTTLDITKWTVYGSKKSEIHWLYQILIKPKKINIMLLCLCSIMIKIWKNTEYSFDLIKNAMFIEDKTTVKIGVQGCIYIKFRWLSYSEMACEWGHSKRLNRTIFSFFSSFFDGCLFYIKPAFIESREKTGKSKELKWPPTLQQVILILEHNLPSGKVNLVTDLLFIFLYDEELLFQTQR